MRKAAVVLFTALCGSASAQIGQHPIPAPWVQADIGDVGVPGGAYQTSDADFAISGAGSDIWGTADSFHFVYQRIEDGEITAQYPSQDASNPYAKVGVMIRLTTDPGSPHVILDVRPTGDIEFMTRATPDGPTTYIAGTTARGYLHLVRANGTVTGIVCPFDSSNCQTVGSVNFPTGMALVGAIATSHDPTVLNHGFFAANMPTVSTVPSPFASYDVGDVGLRGAGFFQNNNQFTVEGAGADIWGTSDSYHLVAAPMRGSGYISATVFSESGTDTFAKAGVMIGGGSPSAPTVILDIRPNGEVEFMARTSAGASMQFIGGMSDRLPVQLKIQRDVNTFTGFTSHDGHDFTYIGSIDVEMPTDPSAGLAVTSHDRASLNSATFYEVNITSEGFSDSDIGDVGAVGWHGAANGHEVVNGSGADIWGTTDAFNYYSTDLINDGYMDARFLNLDNTSTWAKAGIMIRGSNDPSAPHVILDVKPDGSVEFMTRQTQGGSTTYFVGVGAQPFPVTLQLTRRGNQVMGYVTGRFGSTVSLGPISIDLPSHAMIGIAVTSHLGGTLAQAGVDNINH